MEHICNELCNELKSFFHSAVQAFTVTNERSKVITFSQPIDSLYHSLFIKNPEGSLNLKAYVDPLTEYAWMAIGMFAIVGSLSLFLITQ